MSHLLLGWPSLSQILHDLAWWCLFSVGCVSIFCAGFVYAENRRRDVNRQRGEWLDPAYRKYVNECRKQQLGLPANPRSLP